MASPPWCALCILVVSLRLTASLTVVASLAVQTRQTQSSTLGTLNADSSSLQTDDVGLTGSNESDVPSVDVQLNIADELSKQLAEQPDRKWLATLHEAQLLDPATEPDENSWRPESWAPGLVEDGVLPRTTWINMSMWKDPRLMEIARVDAKNRTWQGSPSRSPLYAADEPFEPLYGSYDSLYVQSSKAAQGGEAS
eukprot:TRINITY_DN102209_c0_g1_i1.p1 TRINITY_DN102209_c0_g1~~TRINITY_DN102209_c0_g1_i1.p1  ORF type:complete len:196 (+),score=26.97 TRINITY_DN102209_c0_g1_i1:59-646(+)